MTEAALDVNYRSSETIVNFARPARYRSTLTSDSPHVRPNLDGARGRALTWPSDLIWTPKWENLLDPDTPAVAFVNPDARSSRWN